MEKIRVMQNKGHLMSKERANTKSQITPLGPNLMKNAPAVIMGSMFTDLKGRDKNKGRRKNIYSRKDRHPFQKNLFESDIFTTEQ